MFGIYNALIFFLIIHCVPGYTLHSVLNTKGLQSLSTAVPWFRLYYSCRIGFVQNLHLSCFLFPHRHSLPSWSQMSSTDIRSYTWSLGEIYFFFCMSAIIYGFKLPLVQLCFPFPVLCCVHCLIADLVKIGNVIRWKSPINPVQYGCRAKTPYTMKEIAQQFV